MAQIRFKGPETRESDFAAEQPETPALSGSQRRQVAIKISGSPAAGHIPEREHFTKSKRFRRSPRPRDRLSASDYETTFGSVDSQRAKRVVDWREIGAALDQHDLTLQIVFNGHPVYGSTYYLRRSAPPHPRFPLRLIRRLSPGPHRARKEAVLLRVMLEKVERRRAPPPASDHPAVPRGYV
jgi:hypothetical protein